MHPFFHLSIVFWLDTLSKQYVIKLPGLPYFGGISSSLAASLFLIFISTESGFLV